MVMLGKAFPYPQQCGFGALHRHSPDGAGVWSQWAYRTSSRLQLQCSGCCYPPAQVTAFRVLWGHLRGFSLIVAYADSIEPGSYRG